MIIDLAPNDIIFVNKNKKRGHSNPYFTRITMPLLLFPLLKFYLVGVWHFGFIRNAEPKLQHFFLRS